MTAFDGGVKCRSTAANTCELLTAFLRAVKTGLSAKDGMATKSDNPGTNFINGERFVERQLLLEKLKLLLLLNIFVIIFTSSKCFNGLGFKLNFG